MLKNSYYKISWILLLISLVVKGITFQHRDTTALFNAGLSVQNIIQVITTILVLIWSFYLITSNRVLIKHMLNKPLRYITFLIILYIISTVWSVWPIFTLYKSLELLGYFILSIYLFKEDFNFAFLKKLLLSIIIITWVGGLLLPESNNFGNGVFIGAIRANTASLIAAVYILLTLFDGNAKYKKIRLIFGLISLLVFGSFATIIAFIISLIYIYYKWVHRFLRPILFFIALVLFFINLYLFLFGFSDQFLKELAIIFGKKEEFFYTFTGRITLWKEIIQTIYSNIFGLGFAAGERTFVIFISSVKKVGWYASHAHSGYLSSLIGVGIIGPLLVIKIIYSVWEKCIHYFSNFEKFITGTIILILVNNLTIMGIGGQFNPVWLIIFAFGSLAMNSLMRVNQNFENIK